MPRAHICISPNSPDRKSPNCIFFRSIVLCNHVSNDTFHRKDHTSNYSGTYTFVGSLCPTDQLGNLRRRNFIGLFFKNDKNKNLYCLMYNINFCNRLQLKTDSFTEKKCRCISMGLKHQHDFYYTQKL